MKQRIRKVIQIGNSKAITLPNDVLNKLNINKDEEQKIIFKENELGEIVIENISKNKNDSNALNRLRKLRMEK